MVVLGIGSLEGMIRAFASQLDPGIMIECLHAGNELGCDAFVTPEVRILAPFPNLYGATGPVGGALYSAHIFWRKWVLLHRKIGSILNAVGALLSAFGGTSSRTGIANALYLYEVIIPLLIFIGFLRATMPVEARETAQSLV
jgi:hypothetical protein